MESWEWTVYSNIWRSLAAYVGPFCAFSPRTLPENCIVADLINDAGQWKVTWIKELFINQEVEAILKIPLAGVHQEDRLVWGKNENGSFSIRSAYWLVEDLRSLAEKGNLGASCSNPYDQNCWKNICSLNVANKIKKFLWKACNKILPIYVNLCRKHVVQNTWCPICNGVGEDVTHALWTCHFAKQKLNYS